MNGTFRGTSLNDWDVIDRNQAKWEHEELDVERLDDGLTRSQIADIFTGRSKRDSSSSNAWNSKVATVSKYWREEGPLLLFLYDCGGSVDAHGRGVTRARPQELPAVSVRYS